MKTTLDPPERDYYFVITAPKPLMRLVVRAVTRFGMSYSDPVSHSEKVVRQAVVVHGSKTAMWALRARLARNPFVAFPECPEVV
jgi:hypothetical protein